MKNTQTKRTWFLISAGFVLLLSILNCSSSTTLSTATPVDTHGFSNLVLDNDIFWFGAGYKLYRVDLNQRVSAVVYDAKDIVITFVQTDENRLYFGGYYSPSGNGSVIWSIDVGSGNIIWKKEITDIWGRGWIFVPPLINKDTIIFGTKTILYGIDKAHGDDKWKIEHNWFGTDLDPIVANGLLFYEIDNEYFGGDKTLSGRTLAIADPQSGETIKMITMPGRLGAIPAIHGDCLFVKDYEHYERDSTGKLQWIGELRLNCVDLNTGEIVWTYNGNGVSASSRPSFNNGLVFDVFANQLYALDEQTGVLKWQSPELEAAARNPQVIEEEGIIALNIPSSDKVVFLDLKNGKLQENELTNALSSPVFVGDEAIYGTTNALVRVDIITGDVIWSIPVDSKYQVFQAD